jgi:hypothetical protein
MSQATTMTEHAAAWNEFNRHYPRLIAAIGDATFLQRLSELTTAIVGYDSLVVMSFDGENAPVVL